MSKGLDYYDKQLCVYLIYVFKQSDVKGLSDLQLWNRLKSNVTMWKGLYVGIHAKYWSSPLARYGHSSENKSAVYKYCIANDCAMYEAKVLVCNTEEEYRKLETFIWYYAESILDENFEVINRIKPTGYLTLEEEKKAQMLAINGDPLLRFQESGKNPDNLFDLGYICTPKDFKNCLLLKQAKA